MKRKFQRLLSTLLCVGRIRLSASLLSIGCLLGCVVKKDVTPVPGVDTLAVREIAGDGPEAVDAGATVIATLFQSGRFDEIESLLLRYSLLSDCFDDGRFKLTSVEQFFDNLASPGDADFEARYQQIRAWRTAHPNSVAAARAEAVYWRNYAWHARGQDYGANVPPEQMALFLERLGKAGAVLAQSRSFAKQDPFWYVDSVEVAMESGQPLNVQLALYEEGKRSFPNFFILDFAMLRNLEPRWGGSAEAQAAFIERAVTQAPKSEAEIVYTRLWWFVDQGVTSDGSGTLVANGLSWPRMREGFEQLTGRWRSSSWIASNFAYFACREFDWATYTRVRGNLGPMIRADLFRIPFPLSDCDERSKSTAQRLP
jgi:hypothetical protein